MPGEAPSPSPSPDPVFALSDAFVAEWATLHPALATFVGLPGHDHRWGDLGPAGAQERRAFWARYAAGVRALPPARDPWGRLARAVLLDQCEEKVESFDCGDQTYDLNSIESTFQHLRQVFDVAPVSNREGWEAVVSRLDTLGAAGAGYMDSLREGIRTGRTVARRQVEAVLKQSRRHSGPDSFFETLIPKFDGQGIGDPALRSRLVSGVARARSAFGELARFLQEEYAPQAPERDAVGEERYLRAVRRHLGLSLDPRETYAWGLAEVAEIEAEMEAIARSIRPGHAMPETIAALTADPALSVPSPEQFVEFIHDRQLEALARLSGVHFDVPELARRVEVRIAPKGGALGAYYMPPTEDGSRPGTIWYSLGDETVIPIYDEVSTGFHEGFPGHHLQCSIQVAQGERLSRFQRLIAWKAGYGEGWALYAEQLMRELGFLDRPEYVLGMLSKQLMRAWRVVVDIGLHLELPMPPDASFRPGEVWDHGRAVEAMVTRAFTQSAHAESEVVRYLGWPGQAIAYKVGQRALLGLREQFRRDQGPAFELKGFHARVLEVGSVGLDLLRAQLRS